MLFLECNFTLLGYVGQLSELLEAAKNNDTFHKQVL